MSELIQTLSTPVWDDAGTEYEAQIRGAERGDGTWIGWIDFVPLDDGGPVRRTGEETEQANRSALEYWASGIEPVYLEGAFARAEPGAPPPQ